MTVKKQLRTDCKKSAAYQFVTWTINYGILPILRAISEGEGAGKILVMKNATGA